MVFQSGVIVGRYIVIPPELQLLVSAYFDDTVQAIFEWLYYLSDQILIPSVAYSGFTFFLCIVAVGHTFALWQKSQHMQNIKEIVEDQKSQMKNEVLEEIMEVMQSKFEKEVGPLRKELKLQVRVHEKQRLMLLKQNKIMEDFRSSLAKANSSAAAQANQSIAFQQQMTNRVCDELNSLKRSLDGYVDSSLGRRRVRSRTL